MEIKNTTQARGNEMTFKQFQESKKIIKDLKDQDDETTQGFIYLSGKNHSPYAYENLFIESRGEIFYLCICNLEWEDKNIEVLEAKLFKFAMQEGWGGEEWEENPLKELHYTIESHDDGIAFLDTLIKNKLMFHLDDDVSNIIWEKNTDQTTIDLITKRHQELWSVGNPWEYAEELIGGYLDEN